MADESLAKYFVVMVFVFGCPFVLKFFIFNKIGAMSLIEKRKFPYSQIMEFVYLAVILVAAHAGGELGMFLVEKYWPWFASGAASYMGSVIAGNDFSWKGLGAAAAGGAVGGLVGFGNPYAAATIGSAVGGGTTYSLQQK